MDSEIWLFTIIPIKRKIRINGKVRFIETYIVRESEEWKKFKNE